MVDVGANQPLQRGLLRRAELDLLLKGSFFEIGLPNACPRRVEGCWRQPGQRAEDQGIGQIAGEFLVVAVKAGNRRDGQGIEVMGDFQGRVDQATVEIIFGIDAGRGKVRRPAQKKGGRVAAVIFIVGSQHGRRSIPGREHQASAGRTEIGFPVLAARRDIVDVAAVAGEPQRHPTGQQIGCQSPIGDGIDEQMTTLADFPAQREFGIERCRIGHDIDRAALCAAAEERVLRTPQHLDAFDIEQLCVAAEGGLNGAVDSPADCRVDWAQGLSQDADPANAAEGETGVPRIIDGEVRRRAGDRPRGVEGGDRCLFRSDNVDADRHVAQPLLASAGGDGNRVQDERLDRRTRLRRFGCGILR